MPDLGAGKPFYKLKPKFGCFALKPTKKDKTKDILDVGEKDKTQIPTNKWRP